MKGLMRLILAALVLAVAGTALADDSWERVKSSGKLVIGLDDAFPPMGFRQDGEIVGFDVDAAHELGQRLGIEIEWHPTAWDGVIHSLNSKKFDCIWNGMTITEERARQVSFTRPYIMDGQIVVVAMDEQEIADFEDLEGKIIGVQKGSSALEAVDALPREPGKVREYENNPKAFLDLEAGRLDAMVVDNVAGRYYIGARPGKFKVLPGTVTTEPFGIAFRKEDQRLREVVQEEIDAMVADGTLAEISRKWFGEDITNPEKW
ncbi:MAG: amino acid ABC transporter substrate-binding protein [Desulfonatronovibrionaceae bacterium]